MNRKNPKGVRFQDLISRADEALNLEFYLEASWITYSLLEERLKSITAKLNLQIINDTFYGNLQEITNKHSDNTYINKHLDYQLLINLDKWRLERNRTMHDLAKEDIDQSKIKSLALEGREMFAHLSSAIMRMKKEIK